MSADATGTGDHTRSNVTHSNNPSGGESASAENTSTAGGGYLGPASHTNGPHEKDWKNVLDPRWDANDKSAEVQARARAQAKAEAEHEKQAEIERTRAQERGDHQAEMKAEKERLEAEKAGEAMRAKAEGKKEMEQQAAAQADQAEREKQDAIERAKREARDEAERERLVEKEQEEVERREKSGGVKDALKNIGRNVHGAGEHVRGKVNARVDRKFGHEEAATRHEQIAQAGGKKIADGATEEV